METKNAPYQLDRIFKIRRIKNTIDLSDSFSIVNKKESVANFDAEIYKVTFSTIIQQKIKNFDLFLSGNELIDDQEIENLKESLGIVIAGDGSLFEILDYKTDFTIQFDQENSSFLESDEVRNGLIVFRK
ncbi:hypothetical protein [Flavobacterium pectinovorum]|uniref:Uncharacterized protein n=1 Tax=Flavobacterium pectinovorum TaxID=29533 RepID=A0A502EW94_9FLAO|nr:hypothetical protein [Flavobacterium pectinovorum]TPG42003.1 hypothetical protein EAH81_06675 [Flavobacterium pectinovorum]